MAHPDAPPVEPMCPECGHPASEHDNGIHDGVCNAVSQSDILRTALRASLPSGRGDVSEEDIAWLNDFILPEPLLDDDGEPRMASATEQMESDHASRILSALDGQRREGK